VIEPEGGSLAAVIPETQYTRLGDLHLAYQVLGEGPPDILLLDQWLGHMDAQWDVPPMAAFRRRMASFRRLIMFDSAGRGLDRSRRPLPTIEWMDDVPPCWRGEVRQAVVVTNIGGGIMAMTYAAAHPERVASLVLVDCFARYLAADDFPIGAPLEVLEEALQEAESGAGRGVMIDLFAPSLAGDERLRRAWSRYERQQASPGSTAAIVRLIYESDVRAILPAIRVPTLILHRTHATGFRVEHGDTWLLIPGARLVELPGVDNLIWAEDQDAIGEIGSPGRSAPEPNRVLATVLFTDIVGSTRRAAELGDSAWQALLAEHHRLARRDLERFAGLEVKTVGDGILATFDGPARAIRCAAAIRDAVRELGLELRAGLHTGEIEIQPDDISGLAVHIGARISALASGGEVLVSGTVKDLVIGSGLVFEDRGSHELAGVPGTWPLFAVGV
jgi:class 3 adenylate cyclase